MPGGNRQRARAALAQHSAAAACSVKGHRVGLRVDGRRAAAEHEAAVCAQVERSGCLQGRRVARARIKSDVRSRCAGHRTQRGIGVDAQRARGDDRATRVGVDTSERQRAQASFVQGARGCGVCDDAADCVGLGRVHADRASRVAEVDVARCRDVPRGLQRASVDRGGTGHVTEAGCAIDGDRAAADNSAACVGIDAGKGQRSSAGLRQNAARAADRARNRERVCRGGDRKGRTVRGHRQRHLDAVAASGITDKGARCSVIQSDHAASPRGERVSLCRVVKGERADRIGSVHCRSAWRRDRRSAAAKRCERTDCIGHSSSPVSSRSPVAICIHVPIIRRYSGVAYGQCHKPACRAEGVGIGRKVLIVRIDRKRASARAANRASVADQVVNAVARERASTAIDVQLTAVDGQATGAGDGDLVERARVRDVVVKQRARAERDAADRQRADAGIARSDVAAAGHHDYARRSAAAAEGSPGRDAHRTSRSKRTGHIQRAGADCCRAGVGASARKSQHAGGTLRHCQRARRAVLHDAGEGVCRGVVNSERGGSRSAVLHNGRSGCRIGGQADERGAVVV